MYMGCRPIDTLRYHIVSAVAARAKADYPGTPGSYRATGTPSAGVPMMSVCIACARQSPRYSILS